MTQSQIVSPQHDEPQGARSHTVIRGWVGGLLLLFLALFACLVVGVNSGSLEPGSTLAKVTGVSTIATGVIAAVTALIARLRFHDRSWVTMVGLIVPALVVLVFVADLVAGA